MAMEYTQEHKDYLKEIVPGRSQKEITKLFNSKFGTNLGKSAICSSYKRFGFSTGKTGRFLKGQISHNKGKKMPPDLYEKCRGTMFKEGQIPVNHKPVGSERLTKDGYYEIKVAEPNVWKLKHRVIWEEANGPIPRGHVVIFLDSNSLHCELDNLMMISQSTNARLNQSNLRFPDRELTKAGVATAELFGGIGRAKKR